MPEALFDDLPILGELGGALRESMARAEAAEAAAPLVPRRRRARFGWLGSFVVLGLVGTTAAAGTLTLLRGSPIPGPKAEDTQPSMTPKRDSLTVLDLRAPDPDGGRLPFALRTGESEAGQLCVAVGQADGNDFGIVGGDGRFRGLAAGIVDGCGDRIDGDAAVVGARVFNAPEWNDVRSVTYGVGGDDLRSVRITERGQSRAIPVRDGAFLAVTRGYPEDSGLRLTMRFTGDRIVRHGYSGRGFILDPDGPAWKVDAFMNQTRPSQPTTFCVRVVDARPSASGGSSTPLLCDRTRGPRSGEPTPAWHFAARTFKRGDRGQLEIRAPWSYRRDRPRTIVWGYADPKRAASVTVRAPGYLAAQVPRFGGVMAFVLPPAVRASQVRVTVTPRQGAPRSIASRILIQEGLR